MRRAASTTSRMKIPQSLCLAPSSGNGLLLASGNQRSCASSFGTADVGWREGVVALSLHNEAGEVVRRTSVRLSDLRAPTLAR
jgi:hypothetical protein